MLSYTHPLYFPNLVFTGNVHKNTRIYTLNWDKKEEMCRKNHIKWNSEHWPNQNFPFIPSLPQEIDIWATNLKFVVNDAYRKEINRNARRCLEEWNVRRPFDTSIREYCLKTAEAHAFIAFYLIEDCAYDTVNKCFYRQSNSDKFLIRYALSYKFWAHKTGRGCIRRHARLNELEHVRDFDFMALSANNKEFATRAQCAKNFLEAIEKHEQEMEKMSPCIAEPEIPTQEKCKYGTAPYVTIQEKCK